MYHTFPYRDTIPWHTKGLESMEEYKREPSTMEVREVIVNAAWQLSLIGDGCNRRSRVKEPCSCAKPPTFIKSEESEGKRYWQKVDPPARQVGLAQSGPVNN